jgi:adenylosuccinate lyase
MDASLFSVSPVDGRYNKTTQPLQQYFSEFALIRYRVLVEVQYFIALSQLKLSFFDRFPIEKLAEIEKIAAHFSEADAQKIKEIEKTTNHDVKAVEYFLRKKFTDLGLQDYQEFIHFGLTSQDVNNTAFPMMLRDALRNIVLPELELLLSVFSQKTSEWNNISMLARTHGQPASPTTLGKELAVFSERIEIQLALLKQIPATGKFGGATGNFNAHHAAYPQINWIDFANRFMKEELGLNRQQTTTQIEHYDGMANTFSVLASVNTILIDFSRDIWMYVMLEYFKQQVKKDEVGSSAMPHMMIALKSLQKGMGKLLVNSEKISADLNVNWAVLAEAIQTILRREKYPDPYNALKQLTRGNNRIDRKSLISFIDSLAVNEDVKNELRLLTPENYIGIHKK